jgi:adenine-specific DNA methylase
MEKSFIEVQFPISKLSKESYKERKAVSGQTLTGLGKWWGRKPLILVRAAIIGLLLPATDNPQKDREIFLKILTMDDAGLLRRKTKSIPLKTIYERLTPRERGKWFTEDSTPEKPKYRKGLSADEKKEIQKTVFMRMSYDEKLTYCDRPEQIDGPDEEAWAEINAHLGTNASSIVELVQELGRRKFGHIPKVGDAFCGGGSVPFEAARIGCEAYGSDLNPVAALLTWAALNIIGGGEEVVKEVQKAQKEVYDAVDKQVTEWGIEHNERGHRADAFLYCTETRCPECGWMVPLAPYWVIAEKNNTIARLIPDQKKKRFQIEIESNVSADDMKIAKSSGTTVNANLMCPNPDCGQSTPITAIRGDRRTQNGTQYGLRLWENDDLVPRPDDVFQERLYCIRWVETCEDDEGKPQTRRYYAAPDENDLKREQRVLELLQERFAQWQDKGYIPSKKIEPGDKTDEPIRTRGWTHWHHLFNPRQLLVNSLFLYKIYENHSDKINTWGLLLLGRIVNLNSRLCRWLPSQGGGIGGGKETFDNQAFNTLSNYSTRSIITLASSALNIVKSQINAHNINVIDCRAISRNCNIWITDPPYADAINYHELSEFFLAWYEKHLKRLFPEWYTDSKRALAVVGSDEHFRKSMVDCYRNLTDHMPDNGIQIVMFTHQDASVWADLALIIWASGLRVTAAWCIATETDSALKEGNYVQGTVLLVLRKQTSDETAFMDEIYPEVENEVKKQLQSMLALEDKEDPNFGDADYQLAAYAAALRVLTQYKKIEDIDVAYELSKPRKKGEVSPIEAVIANAVKVACDYLVPMGFDSFVWKILTPMERLYLKGLEIESYGEYRSGVYQELARGFGVTEYKPLLGSGKANQTRLKTAVEFGTKELGTNGFGSSLVRNALFAVRETVRNEDVQTGKNWLRNEVPDYWNQRGNLVEILRYLSNMGFKIDHWKQDAEAAGLLAGAVENDHI